MKNINDKINEGFFQNVGADAYNTILQNIKTDASKKLFQNLIEGEDTIKASKMTYSVFAKNIWNADNIIDELYNIVSQGNIITSLKFEDKNDWSNIGAKILVNYKNPQERNTSIIYIYSFAELPVIITSGGKRQNVSIKTFMSLLK